MSIQASRRQRGNSKCGFKRHGGSVETTNVKSSVTAAASPFERGATTVAGYVSRWRSQHNYQKSFYYMDFLHLFYDTYPPASPYPSQEGTRSSSPIVYQTRLLTSRRQRRGYNRPDKRHGGNVETTSVVSNVTAAASPFERGATTVAGYVSRWRSQHKYHYRL